MNRIRFSNRARTTPSHRARGGFSFVELIMVILITGIMVTIATPKLTVAQQQFRVTNGAKRIAADLNRAQLAAYNSSLTKTVNFNQPSGRLRTGNWRVDRQSISV